MPPQQPDRLLDLLDEVLGFRAHLMPILGNCYVRKFALTTNHARARTQYRT
jgi:hypothetical protein